MIRLTKMVENQNGWISAEDSDPEEPFARRTRSQTGKDKKSVKFEAREPVESRKLAMKKSILKKHRRDVVLKRKKGREVVEVKERHKKNAVENSENKKRKAIEVVDLEDDSDDDVHEEEEDHVEHEEDAEDDDEYVEEFAEPGRHKRRRIQGGSGQKFVGKRHPSMEKLKKWDFYIHPKRHFKARIGVHTNVDAVKMLKEKLNEKQLKMFRETCFGYFLDLPDVVLQPQLIHSLLLRELFQEKEDELWISVNGVRLHFGISEFALITGLKCTGYMPKRLRPKKNSRLADTYFTGIIRPTKQSIIDCFHSQRWTSDQDAVKLAVLYFIHTFLFSNLLDRTVGRGDIELVESGDYEYYPWGKAVFKSTIHCLKNGLLGEKSMYRVLGFPLAFQCWFYECCPSLSDAIAHRIGNKVPRLLNWRITKQPKSDELSREIFNRKLKLKNISPTQVEESRLNVLDLIINEEDQEEDNEAADRDDVDLHIISDDDFTSPDRSRNPIKSTGPPLNNMDWRGELKQLFVGQLKLKEEVKSLNKEVASFKGFMATSLSNIFKANQVTLQ